MIYRLWRFYSFKPIINKPFHEKLLNFDSLDMSPRHADCFVCKRLRTIATVPLSAIMTMHAITPPPAHHFDEMLVTAGARSEGNRRARAIRRRAVAKSQSQGTRAHYAAYNDWLQSVA